MVDQDLAGMTGSRGTPVAQNERLGPAQGAEFKIVLPFGIPAFVCAITSLAMCYVNIIVASVLGVASLGLNPHVQAVLMWSIALLAVLALWRDRRRHGNNLPVVLAAVAVGVLIGTLYVHYVDEWEAAAYVLLVVAVMLNQNVFLGLLNRTVRQQAREIEALNQSLEHKVEDQSHEIGRLARLKQFLSPQVAELVMSEGKYKLLDTHRRYIACLFCDIRDFTAASENIEPEEVIAILQAYHERIGGLVTEHHGTIGYRAGDGLMAFFNDPIPCEEPVLEAVRLALDIRAAFNEISEPWLKLGHPIGLGIGIASGYATLGLIGFQGRTDYTAIGGVVNIAARLCDKAADGQILLSQRAFVDVKTGIRVDRLGSFELKGVRNPVETYSLGGLGEAA